MNPIAHRSLLALPAVFVLLGLAARPAAAAEPLGAPRRVNQLPTGPQNILSVASGANGDSVVLWTDAARGSACFVQAYDAAGAALKGERFVGYDATDVAVSGTGSYVVTTSAPDAAGKGAFATLYDRNGRVLRSTFRVNDVTTGEQYPNAVAMNASGQFAVTWQTWGVSGPPAYAVTAHVKLFRADGVALTGDLLATSPTSREISSDVGVDALGGVVLVWDEIVANSLDSFMRRYSATGTLLGPTTRINTVTVSNQGYPHVATTLAGSIVVWTACRNGDCTQTFIDGQRFSPTGARVGAEFQVSEQASYGQPGRLSIAAATNGAFTVTWQGFLATGIAPTMARAFDAAAAPLGPASGMEPSPGTSDYTAFVGMDPGGNATIAWRRVTAATNDADVYVQRFLPAGVSVRPLTDGEIVSELAGEQGSWQYFKVTVPEGHGTLEVRLTGTVGDADLYIRRGGLPSFDLWDGRPYLEGSTEAVQMLQYPPGDWYIGVQGYAAFSDVELAATSSE